MQLCKSIKVTVFISKLFKLFTDDLHFLVSVLYNATTVPDS